MKRKSMKVYRYEKEFPILRGRLLKQEPIALPASRSRFPILRGRLLKKWIHAIDVDWEEFPILRGRLLKQNEMIFTGTIRVSFQSLEGGY